MTIQNDATTQFLEQLYTLTKGDPMVQQSMYDVGSNLGWDRERSGKIAEDLIGQGLVEIKTLSGGIGITTDGIAAVQSTTGPTHSPGTPSLGSATVMDETGRSTVSGLLDEIKILLTQSAAPYPQLEEMVIDIKTIETQMLSPQPKVAVIRELFHSLQQALSTAGLDDMASKVGQVAGE